MYCAKCGARVQPDHRFCSVCGEMISASSSSPPPPAAQTPQPLQRGRVERHLQLLGILWIVFSVMRLLPGIGILGLGSRVLFPFLPFHLTGFLMPMMRVFGLVIIALGVAGILAGWALLQRVSWGRTLALVVGIISLIHLPFGTALGIYTLWVLMPAASEEEFRRIAHPA